MSQETNEKVAMPTIEKAKQRDPAQTQYIACFSYYTQRYRHTVHEILCEMTISTARETSVRVWSSSEIVDNNRAHDVRI